MSTYGSSKYYCVICISKESMQVNSSEADEIKEAMSTYAFMTFILTGECVHETEREQWFSDSPSSILKNVSLQLQSQKDLDPARLRLKNMIALLNENNNNNHKIIKDCMKLTSAEHQKKCDNTNTNTLGSIDINNSTDLINVLKPILGYDQHAENNVVFENEKKKYKNKELDTFGRFVFIFCLLNTQRANSSEQSP